MFGTAIINLCFPEKIVPPTGDSMGALLPLLLLLAVGAAVIIARVLLGERQRVRAGGAGTQRNGASLFLVITAVVLLCSMLAAAVYGTGHADSNLSTNGKSLCTADVKTGTVSVENGFVKNNSKLSFIITGFTVRNKVSGSNAALKNGSLEIETFNQPVALSTGGVDSVDIYIDGVLEPGKTLPVYFRLSGADAEAAAQLSGLALEVEIRFASMFDVVFDPNGKKAHNMPEPYTVIAGITVPMPQQIPEASGYSLEGWYLDKACTRKWDPSKPLSCDGDTLTIYAGWQLAPL